MAKAKSKALSRSKQICKMCELLGIETRADLERFCAENQRNGETMGKAIERYFVEIMDGKN